MPIEWKIAYINIKKEGYGTPYMVLVPFEDERIKEIYYGKRRITGRLLRH